MKSAAVARRGAARRSFCPDPVDATAAVLAPQRAADAMPAMAVCAPQARLRRPALVLFLYQFIWYRRQEAALTEVQGT